MLNEAESASTSMRWVLRSRCGSAQISSVVRSAPMPANASATATFRFAGKPAAASRGEPLKMRNGSLMSSIAILCSTKYGAPTRPRTGLRVIMRTEWMVPSAAAVTASSPMSAPVGAMIWPPCSRARSISAILRSSAPMLNTIRVLPARSTGSAITGSRSAGAHSTTTSQCSASASMRVNTHGVFSVMRAAPCCGSRKAIAVSRSPSIPASSLCATLLPMAPRPAMPTRTIF